MVDCYTDTIGSQGAGVEGSTHFSKGSKQSFTRFL